MNRIDFLNELYYHLESLPRSEKEEIIADFREHFREGIAAGKSEEQICDELGTPFECARQYVGDAIIRNSADSFKKEKRKKAFWTAAFVWNVIQAIISVPITFGLFLAAAIMIAVYCFMVPAIASTAFLVFAIASTATVFFLAIITLLWAIIEIKECVERINK